MATASMPLAAAGIYMVQSQMVATTSAAAAAACDLLTSGQGLSQWRYNTEGYASAAFNSYLYERVPPVPLQAFFI